MKTTIQLGDSPYYVSPYFLINSIKKEFMERISKIKCTSFDSLFLKNDERALYCRLNDDVYNKSMDHCVFISRDQKLIDLYNAILLLEQSL